MKMYICLLTLVLIHAAAAFVAQNATGRLAGKDHCVCEVLLPDSSFPAKRVGALEDETVRLSNRVEDEMQKLDEQDIRLDTYLEKIINLTSRVEYLEKLRPEALMEVNFEVLKKEIKEMEMYISAMRVKPNGNTVEVETLYNEVKNMSKTVGQLETLDTNNVLKTKREMENFKKRLVDCEKGLKPKPPMMVPLGSCQHQGLARIGKPNLLQLNWKGSAYKSGAWGKDAAWNTTKRSLYWVAPLNADGRVLESVRIYPFMSDLQMYKNFIDLPLSVLIKGKWNHTFAGQGAGMVVYNNNLYYNCYNSHDMCRVSLTSGVYQRKPLPNALFNNRVSYAGTTYQDFDFASDEKGLWVMYTTEKSAGKIVVGKVNVATLTVDISWTTTQQKSGVSNAFMICGVLYATRSLNPKMEEVFYMFDTKTGKEGQLSIVMEKMAEKVQSLSYNSNERKIYMYSEGYLLHYDVAMKP
ncbi:PREDICTED: olfactomedin [Nanorana parkeri]|uniref:olfactomedin n=1 Tax=Nanorana parkeri TaxID=125878 RepID=UPI0008541D9D|nr:PREDICTED: olfactomedin [Nanorana parkeri]